MNMTIDILLESLELLKSQGSHPDYKRQAIHESICELYRLERSLPEYHKDIWNGAIHVVHMTTAIDMQINLMYDVFGKLAKSKNNNEVSFGEYEAAAREIFGFDAASTQFLMSGYEVINDLWHDNERNGCHNDDGTCDNTCETTELPFKVISYEYMNTGGGCMVGIFEVWLPTENCVRYVLVNEAGGNLTTVDYISNELGIDDYDEVTLDSVEWLNVTGNERYFELYRYCLNEYTKSDCKHFGQVAEVPYILLSDELQGQVPNTYRQFADEERNGVIPTDGNKICI